MPYEIFLKAVSPMIEQKKDLTVCLMGGEPTMHKKIAPMIRYLKQNSNVYVDINTNGTRLTKCAESLIDAGIDAIYISFDGSNAEINDQGRGAGSFVQALEGLRHTKELIRQKNSKVRLAVNHTITRENYTDIIDMARFAIREELDELFMNLTIFVTEREGHAAAEGFHRALGIKFSSWKGFVIDEMIDHIDLNVLEKQIQYIQETDWGDLDIFMAPIGYDARELRTYFSSDWYRTLKSKSCPVQDFRTTIMPNGDVVPCTIYPDIVMGNLKEQELSAIWLGEEYMKFRNHVKQKLFPTCVRCCDLFDESQGDPNAFLNESRFNHRL